MRIDSYLHTVGIAKSRTAAQMMISEGRVLFQGKIVTKTSFDVCDGSETDITILNGGCPYVSRGGLKLEAALDAFSIDPSEMCALDIGASTGGFTDCLLKKGARRVYAVDSGRNQIDPAIANDPRVIVREGYNARYMMRSDFADEIDLAVMDVSFISQTLLLPAIAELLPCNAILISLIKPQFEVGRSGIGRGGIVRDEKLRDNAVKRVCDSAAACRLLNFGLIPSPITGGDGNHEFLACFRKERL